MDSDLVRRYAFAHGITSAAAADLLRRNPELAENLALPEAPDSVTEGAFPEEKGDTLDR